MKNKVDESFLSQEKNVIKTDLQHLERMKTDKAASYSSVDKTNIKRVKKRRQKVG